MDDLQLRCGMCLRLFTYPRQHKGRLPRHCPECTLRRMAERSRQRMAAMRARREQAATAV